MVKIGLAEELPLREVPNGWSENFYFVAFEPRQQIGFAIHMGRWSRNALIWREQAMMFLPDGSFAISRGFGNRSIENGPCGALLDVICEVPGKRWRLHYNGPTRRTTKEELARGLLIDAPLQLLEFELTFTATSDIWDFGASMKEEVWAKSHYEQTGRMTGFIRYDQQSVSIDAFAYRDHSRGPRNYTGMNKTVWMQGHFANGRSFALVDIQMQDRPAVPMARIYQGGRVYDASYHTLPYMTSLAELPMSFAFTLDSEFGPMDVAGKFERILPWMLDSHHESYYGAAIIPGITRLMSIIGPTSLTWDGLSGVGHAEFAFGVY